MEVAHIMAMRMMMQMVMMMTCVDDAEFCSETRQHQRCIKMLPLCPYIAPDMRIANSIRKRNNKHTSTYLRWSCTAVSPILIGLCPYTARGMCIANCVIKPTKTRAMHGLAAAVHR